MKKNISGFAIAALLLIACWNSRCTAEESPLVQLKKAWGKTWEQRGRDHTWTQKHRMEFVDGTVQTMLVEGRRKEVYRSGFLTESMTTITEESTGFGQTSAVSRATYEKDGYLYADNTIRPEEKVKWISEPEQQEESSADDDDVVDDVFHAYFDIPLDDSTIQTQTANGRHLKFTVNPVPVNEALREKKRPEEIIRLTITADLDDAGRVVKLVREEEFNHYSGLHSHRFVTHEDRYLGFGGDVKITFPQDLESYREIANPFASQAPVE